MDDSCQLSRDISGWTTQKITIAGIVSKETVCCVGGKVKH